MNGLTVPKFERLSITLQDTCFWVRREFAESLIKGLSTEQIHPRYYALLFLIAHEPEEALLKQVKNFLKKRISTLQQQTSNSDEFHSVLDSSLIRLIHLLAHHPDFSVAVEDLKIFAKYIKFYLACVATPDNVSFLFHIVQKIKLSKDMVANELSQVRKRNDN
jgi:sister-chromatid-cohesion protein PDS5